MNKFIYFAIAAIAALSSCSSDDGVANETPSTNPGQAGAGKAPVFKATIEGAATSRTTLEVNSLTSGGTGTVKWESTDEVIINNAVYKANPNATDATKAELTHKSGTAPTADYKAYFPTSLKSGSTLTLPPSYTYEGNKCNMPMYAESSTTELQFKNLCGILAITVPYKQLTSVKSIIVSSDKQMNGAFSVTSPTDLTFNTGSTAVYSDKKVTLTFSTAVDIPNNDSTAFYVAIPPQTYGYLHVAVKDNSGVIKSMRTKGKSTVTIARSQIYPIAFRKDQTCTAPFLYSVNAGTDNNPASLTDNKRVCFTRSNIYWDGSNYRFEEQPTNYRLARVENHINYFYWTSIYDYNNGTGSKPYAETHESTSPATTDKLFCGEENKMTVEGSEGLFVLSRSEWDHLLNGTETTTGCRQNANNLRKYATVAGVKCLIIAHDEYNYTANPLKDSYTAAEWAEAEKLGVVCLPFAGGNGSELTQTTAYYWSSTPASDVTGNAFYLHVTESECRTYNNTRGAARSIRLVYLPPTTP